ARGSSDYGTSWTTTPIDLTSDYIQYNWSECVFPSTSWSSDDYLYITFQDDDYAGSYVQGSSQTGYQGQSGPTDNRIRFLKPSKTDILFPVGTSSEQRDAFSVSQNFPNPVTDQTTVNVQISQQGNLELEVTSIMGRQIETISRGSCAAGTYSFTINTKGLAPGVYFYTVTFNNANVTRKMVVE
ncbi:MAG: T9SS type A sorting domain-containing protein, partial [Bacteroidales bacterium]|nr:T9SS type A sorting domain-containing protein [Bacteroidales bacterium]